MKNVHYEIDIHFSSYSCCQNPISSGFESLKDGSKVLTSNTSLDCHVLLKSKLLREILEFLASHQHLISYRIIQSPSHQSTACIVNMGCSFTSIQSSRQTTCNVESKKPSIIVAILASSILYFILQLRDLNC